MPRRNKISNYINRTEEFLKLCDNDIKMIYGGIIKDTGSSYQIINTTGIGVVRSKIPYGGNSGMTKEDAFEEAKRLDNIDYSKKS